MEGELQGLGEAVTAGFVTLNLDLSPPTLAKYGILLIAILALLWVIGDVYRGELQNRNMPIEVTAHDRPGYGHSDVLFTRRTFDTRSERLPAKVIVEHTFVISQGDRVFSRRVRVLRKSYKLHAQYRQTMALRDGQFAFSSDVEKEIKNRAEYLVRASVRSFRRSPQNWLRRVLKAGWVEPEATGARYIARIHFPSNPFFLLFQHPDREVKATGWLTLLTSVFALLGQFLFSEPNRPAHTPDSAAVHRSTSALPKSPQRMAVPDP